MKACREDNKNRAAINSIVDKYVHLNPTIGFNREKYTGKVEYNVWDIGGS